MSVGGRLPISPNRRLVHDLIHCSRGVALYPLERSFELGALADLRQRSPVRISWAVIFLKAYGLLSAAVPQLRQSYLRWPWRHLYQNPHSVAMLAINRQFAGEDRLCWGRFIAPEERSLLALQQRLDRYKEDPVESAFRRQVWLSRFPTPVRRLAWSINFDFSGAVRAKRFGTFGMSTLAGYGAVNRYHPSPLTTSLTYGPLDERGRTLVTIVYDHRVLDGAPLAAALNQLETILNETMARELADLARQSAAA